MRPLFFLLAACTGDTPPVTPASTPLPPVELRVATWNVSMFRSGEGALAIELRSDQRQYALLAAQVLQELRPDVLLLNELDWDAEGLAVQRLLENYLEIGQEGREPLAYPHVWIPEVNTGVHSGVDLNGDGTAQTTLGSAAYAEDAFGYGTFPGQYGMVVLSRHPIDAAAIRTFRTLRWADMPGALLPTEYYSPAAVDVLRLSSKTHADVPIDVGGHTLHLLISHPTPPAFDGPEDRNGKRNHDEIAFWTSYLDGDADSWHVDDAGRRGGLDGEHFVVVGDLNNDPFDGDGIHAAIVDLLAHPRARPEPAPASPGGSEQAGLQAGINASHAGDPAHDTADFNDAGPGNLRLDYALPSASLEPLGNGVYWPLADDPAFPAIGTFPFPVSDHRPVWVDVRIGG